MIKITKIQEKELLDFARSIILNKFNNSQILELSNSKIYDEKFGVFVTINKNNKLRGCVGFVSGVKSLKESIKYMAIKSAFEDNRFVPLTIEEISEIKIEISILSPLEKIESSDEIIVGEHGLYIENKYHSGLLLPQVATEYKWNREEFISNVCQKAGLADNCFTSCNFYKFNAVIFGE